MILNAIFNLFANAFIILFNALPSLPSFGNEIKGIIDTFLELIFSTGELILFFLPPFSVCSTLVTISIVMEVFVIGYYILMWILGKIPIINVK